MAVLSFIGAQALGPNPAFAAEPLSNNSPVANNNSATAPIPNAGDDATIGSVNDQLAGVITGVDNWLGNNSHTYGTLNTLYRTFERHLGHFSKNLVATGMTLNSVATNSAQSRVLADFYTNNNQALNVDATTKNISIGGLVWQLSSINRLGQQIYRTPGVASNLAIIATGSNGTPSTLQMYNYANETLSSDYVAAGGGDAGVGLSLLGSAISGAAGSHLLSSGISGLTRGNWVTRALSTDINETGSYSGLRRSEYFDDALADPTTAAFNQSVLPTSITSAAGDIGHASLANFRTFLYGGDGVPGGAQTGIFEQWLAKQGADTDEGVGVGYGVAFWALDYLFGHINRILHVRAPGRLSAFADVTTDSGLDTEVTWRARGETPSTFNRLYNIFATPGGKTPTRINVGIERDSSGNILRIIDLNGNGEETSYAATQTDQAAALAALRTKIFSQSPSQDNTPTPSSPTVDPFFGFVDPGSSTSPSPGLISSPVSAPVNSPGASPGSVLAGLPGGTAAGNAMLSQYAVAGGALAIPGAGLIMPGQGMTTVQAAMIASMTGGDFGAILNGSFAGADAGSAGGLTGMSMGFGFGDVGGGVDTGGFSMGFGATYDMGNAAVGMGFTFNPTDTNMSGEYGSTGSATAGFAAMGGIVPDAQVTSMFLDPGGTPTSAFSMGFDAIYDTGNTSVGMGFTFNPTDMNMSGEYGSTGSATSDFASPDGVAGARYWAPFRTDTQAVDVVTISSMNLTQMTLSPGGSLGSVMTGPGGEGGEGTAVGDAGAGQIFFPVGGGFGVESALQIGVSPGDLNSGPAPAAGTSNLQQMGQAMLNYMNRNAGQPTIPGPDGTMVPNPDYEGPAGGKNFLDVMMTTTLRDPQVYLSPGGAGPGQGATAGDAYSGRTGEGAFGQTTNVQLPNWMSGGLPAWINAGPDAFPAVNTGPSLDPAARRGGTGADTVGDATSGPGGLDVVDQSDGGVTVYDSETGQTTTVTQDAATGAQTMVVTDADGNVIDTVTNEAKWSQAIQDARDAGGTGAGDTGSTGGADTGGQTTSGTTGDGAFTPDGTPGAEQEVVEFQEGDDTILRQRPGRIEGGAGETGFGAEERRGRRQGAGRTLRAPGGPKAPEPSGPRRGGGGPTGSSEKATGG